MGEIPNADEILRPKPDSSLPHNPVHTPWVSKEKYLETQYRLLRCEATECLRFSVRSFVEASVRKQELWDNEHTWVYHSVRVSGYLMSRLGPIARVEFGTRSSHKFSWHTSKRLWPGNIVALSPKADGFRTICKVATIAQRPYYGGLDQDPPVVDLMWAIPGDAILDPTLEMVMCESRDGYFEASRHALVGLQLSVETQSPLDKYILGKHTVDTNANFTASQQGELGDLRTLGPSASQLDESQSEALDRILSRELAIIQGPPGTGKTFTSVAAIAAMTALRRKNAGPPLLVAAQTNQALDHLLVACIDSGLNVLRIGGRTSNTRIEEASLHNLRGRRPKLAPDLARELKAVDSARKQNISHIQALVQNMFGRKLLNPKALLNCDLITPEQYNSLEDDLTEVDASLQERGPLGLWLGYDSLIPAKLLRNRHPILSDTEPASPTEEDHLQDGEEIQQISKEAEEYARLQGIFIPLQHVWSGKDPAHLTSWRNMVERELRAPDLFTIRPELRGAVYQHLQAKLLAVMQPKFGQLLEENVRLCKRSKKLKNHSDAALIRQRGIDVVGCTTTGLNKYRQIISEIRVNSLLVEEAAETLEVNIVSAMYPSLRQLILVGDHQQLAPNCDVAWLRRHPYNFTVSLFQRMVSLGVPFTMLKQQRRMSPELRMVLSPFYPDLGDHPEVLQRADIPGMGVRSWFYDHCWPEETNAEHSKFNDQEAQMVVNFYAYLVKNGTPAEKITILTFYVGQRKVLLSKLRRHPSLATLNFKVHTVDSYQGRENDVILLSLVRSPGSDGSASVGFLEDKRRVVVAISRARRGFYLFGNVYNVLKAGPANDNPWAKIFGVLTDQNRANPQEGLPLTCQKHTAITWILENEDWAENAGGCNLRCQELRPCGHPCTLKCHSSLHEDLPCSYPCRQRLPCGHGCEKYCHRGQSCSCRCSAVRSSNPPVQGISRTRNEEQVSQTTPDQWKAFAANITRHDENLDHEHAALVMTQSAKVTSTVIKEIHQATTLVDGFRVGGSQKDVAWIKVPTPPMTPRKGDNQHDHTGVDDIWLALDRLDISSTATTEEQTATSPGLREEGGHGDGNEEWLIQF
ncbi:P-loop containing nucleoside triphosphate hydrolase protein [Podospora conica]|nr:P-loop containing nucleoside triphosphate hydrolase protein [Schizothecium conicum]